MRIVSVPNEDAIPLLDPVQLDLMTDAEVLDALTDVCERLHVARDPFSVGVLEGEAQRLQLLLDDRARLRHEIVQCFGYHPAYENRRREVAAFAALGTALCKLPPRSA
jgi:hypothetical protein